MIDFVRLPNGDLIPRLRWMSESKADTVARRHRTGVERIYLTPEQVRKGLRQLGVMEIAKGVADHHDLSLLALLEPCVRRQRPAESRARQELIAAVVKAKSLSIRKAAMVFGVDRTSIRYALKRAAEGERT